MLNIVLRTFDRISERIMGLHDSVEAETIACRRIVGMVAMSEKTKYPVYRFRVSVWADFQMFVVVGECKCVHNLLPRHTLPAGGIIATGRQAKRPRSIL